jgi:hypothetical protein
VDQEAVERLLLVQHFCGETLGALLSDAIYTWYEQLPVIDFDEESEHSEDVPAFLTTPGQQI